MDHYERVKRYKAVYDGPPRAVPDGDVDVSGNGRWRIWQYTGTKTDAPVLGNGDMLAAFAGPCEYPQFWVTANDFWQMESNPNWVFFHDNSTAAMEPAVTLGGPRPVGRLVFSIPELKGAACRIEQQLGDAVTVAHYDLGTEGKLTIRSMVAATENLLLVRFHSELADPVRIQALFRFPDEPGMGCEKGVDLSGKNESGTDLRGTAVGMMCGRTIEEQKTVGGILSGFRAFEEQVDVPVKSGFGGAFHCPEDREDGNKSSVWSGNAGVGKSCALSRNSDADKWCASSVKANDDEPGVRNTNSNQEDTASLVLRPGESADYVFVLRTWNKVSRPVEMAASRAEWITCREISELRELHRSWWRDFWNVSGICLDDPMMEQRYYLSQYVMASLSRDPDYPPGILGVCTFDRPAWNGNYKINYNHQSAYLGLLASGHFPQADPHDAPYFAMMDIGREMSHRLYQHGGTCLPLGLGPKGMVSEALLLHMKSQAVHGATNMIMRYSLTLDRDYGRKIYPFLQSLADFWEADLIQKDGYLHIRDDSMHERTEDDVRKNGESMDPVNSLGYLKCLFRFLPVISRDLGLDEERRSHWEDIADHLAPYPMGTLEDIRENPTLWAEAEVPLGELVPEEWMKKPVFFDEGKGGKWSYHFPGNIMQIYPAGAIGLGSDPDLLQTGWNTVHVHSIIENQMAEYRKTHDTGADDLDNEQGDSDPHYRKAGAWNATNLSCLFFPAAVRVGYDPEVIWRELEERIVHRGLPNGYINRNPHGIENLSTVPNTLQEMMLLSHEGILRIFRVWPVKSHPNASFERLWAYGAFQVSASLEAGIVGTIQILSRAGRELVLENPWPGEEAEIVHLQTGRREVSGGEYLRAETFPGERLEIRRIKPCYSQFAKGKRTVKSFPYIVGGNSNLNGDG